jgi:hypothetical protein
VPRAETFRSTRAPFTHEETSMKRALGSELGLRAVAAFAVVAGVVAVVGCGGGANDTGAGGSGSGGSGGTAGGAVAGSTGTAGGAGQAAGGATGTAGAAGGPTGTAGGTAGAGGVALCNNLTVTGDFIPQTAGTGTAPTPVGGSIADGTYVLTKVEIFSPLTPSANLLKVTMKVTGKDLQWVSVTGTSAAWNVQSYTTETFGTNWVLTGTCPSAAITPVTPPRFTAMPTSLLLFIAGQVQTYTKQ